MPAPDIPPDANTLQSRQCHSHDRHDTTDQKVLTSWSVVFFPIKQMGPAWEGHFTNFSAGVPNMQCKHGPNQI